MGKKDGTSSSSSSWLTAVKRAFRSPNKDSDKKSSRRKVDHQHQEADEDDKKRERRRWLFRRQSKNTEVSNHEVKECKKSEVSIAPKSTTSQHAIEVAAATAAAAEAAVATAKAAVEIIRLTHPSINAASSASAAVNLKQHSAATVIQTAFRGYLARSALIALKGIVKLQALIRGQIVRRQANMTMKCMKALLRVQSRVRDQRARLSHDVGRRSMFAESTNLWESKYLKDIRARNSRSREGSYVSDDWGECPRTLQELEAIIKARNEAALTHERSLAFAFQQQNQIMDSDRIIPYERDVKELEEVDPTSFLDQWMPSKPWEDNNTGRASADIKREPIKTVEIDSQKPINNNGRRSRPQSPIHTRSQHHINNNHRSSFHNEARTIQSPITPSFASRTRPSQVRSASPRCLKEDRSSHSAANTPSLRMQRAGPRYSTSANNHNYSNNNNDGILPNYMAATESAKARIRSQSAPRQRPCTPDRERGGSGSSSSVKKRLSYPIPEPYCVNFGFGFDGHGRDLRSPSFKSVQAGYVGMAEESTYYAESVVGGEISPCSTTDLRRWLR